MDNGLKKVVSKKHKNREISSFAIISKALLFIISCLIVSLGNPSFIPLLGFIAGAVGYALFFLITLEEKSPKKKFILGTLWFSLVTMIQYGWILTHPYYYIYILYLIGPLILGIEFGLLTLLVTKESIGSIFNILGIAGIWVLLEWFRLFWFMGLSFNPVGMALASNQYSMQSASLGGVYLLSFLVMATNLLFLRWLTYPFKKAIVLFIAALCLPYLFGFTHIQYHENNQKKREDKHLKALLVQTAFEVEEGKGFQEKSLGQKVAEVLDEWKEIAHLVHKGLHEKVDLIILPESVVPFASTSYLFPEESARSILETSFGKELKKGEQLTKPYQGEKGPHNFVCNAFFAQAIAALSETPLLIGMEHIEEGRERKFYSSALLYLPEPMQEEMRYRYDKQILVPLAEYLPFSWLKEVAKNYGIFGSFTHGKEAKLFEINGVRYGVSICYEETVGNLVRKNKILGANALINLTNDGWYPHSKLPKQHLDHAILRTVELGMPLLRACNSGITCAVDSLGRPVHILGREESEQQTLRGTLFVTLPYYNYWTLYSITGDSLIVIFSLLCGLIYLFSVRLKKIKQ